MRTVLLTAGLACFFVGCNSVSAIEASVIDGWKSFSQTMSGATAMAKFYFTRTYENAVTIKTEVEDRVDKVNEGMNKIMEGKKLIDEGLGGEDSTETGALVE